MSAKGLEVSEKIEKELEKKLASVFLREYKALQEEFDRIIGIVGGDLLGGQNYMQDIISSEERRKLVLLIKETDKVIKETKNITQIDLQRWEAKRNALEERARQKLSRLTATKEEIELRALRMQAEAKKEMLKGMQKIQAESRNYELFTQAKKSGGYFENMVKIPVDRMVSLQTKGGGSKTLGTYMNELISQWKTQTEDALINGYVRGDTFPQMSEAMSKATGISFRKAQLLVETEGNAIFNHEVKSIVDENPLIKGYIYRAEMDSRTCTLCSRFDGKYIPKAEVAQGVNFPPVHPRCRCMVTTVEYNADENKDEMIRKGRDKFGNWVEVPKGMKYEEWAKLQGFKTNPAAHIGNPIQELQNAEESGILTQEQVAAKAVEIAKANKQIDESVTPKQWVERVKQIQEATKDIRTPQGVSLEATNHAIVRSLGHGDDKQPISVANIARILETTPKEREYSGVAEYVYEIEVLGVIHVNKETGRIKTITVYKRGIGND